MTDLTDSEKIDRIQLLSGVKFVSAEYSLSRAKFFDFITDFRTIKTD